MIYVCYISYRYEGCSAPLGAFNDPDAAKAFMDEECGDRLNDDEWTLGIRPNTWIRRTTNDALLYVDGLFVK